jgi:hypothetical protein
MWNRKRKAYICLLAGIGLISWGAWEAARDGLPRMFRTGLGTSPTPVPPNVGCVKAKRDIKLHYEPKGGTDGSIVDWESRQYKKPVAAGHYGIIVDMIKPTETSGTRRMFYRIVWATEDDPFLAGNPKLAKQQHWIITDLVETIDCKSVHGPTEVVANPAMLGNEQPVVALPPTPIPSPKLSLWGPVQPCGKIEPCTEKIAIAHNGTFDYSARCQQPASFATIAQGETATIRYVNGLIKPNSPEATADYQPEVPYGVPEAKIEQKHRDSWKCRPVPEQPLHSILVVSSAGRVFVFEDNILILENETTNPITLALVYNDNPWLFQRHTGSARFKVEIRR